MADNGELRDALERAKRKPVTDAVEKMSASRKKPEALRGALERALPPNPNEDSLVWRGPWNKLTSYRVGDVVSHEGSSWRALRPSVGSEPPSSRWEYVAKKGDKGEDGEKGEQGPAGVGIVGPQGPPGVGGGTPATTVESETTFGIAPAVGTGTDYARDDHTHGSPAAPSIPDPATTVVTETAFGQASAVGASADYAREDHTHGTPAAPAGGTPASTVTDETTFAITPAVGVDTEYARQDHTHGSPANPVTAHVAAGDPHTQYAEVTELPDPASTVVTETSFGQASAVGIGTDYARNDHTHGTPAAPSVPAAGGTVVTETSYGQASGAGVDADYSREDHTHGTPAVPNHADLGSVTSDQHHAKSHAHDGADGSGTVAHSATTGQTANDHHAQAHAIGGADHTGTLDHGALTGLLDDDHTQYQKESEKGAASGYAGLTGTQGLSLIGELEQGYTDEGDTTGAKTVALTTGNVHRVRLTGNVTFTFTGATLGKACSLTLILVQDGTGSRLVTWPASVDWPAAAAPVLSTAINSTDIITLLSVDGGTTWYGFLVGAAMA